MILRRLALTVSLLLVCSQARAHIPDNCRHFGEELGSLLLQKAEKAEEVQELIVIGMVLLNHMEHGETPTADEVLKVMDAFTDWATAYLSIDEPLMEKTNAAFNCIAGTD